MKLRTICPMLFLFIGVVLMSWASNAFAFPWGIRERIRERIRGSEENSPASPSSRLSAKEEKKITFGGIERIYYVQLPPNFSTSERSPLIIALHGGGGKGENFDEKMTNNTLGAAADAAGYVRAYPESFEGRWNDGRGLDWAAQKQNIDDVGFIATIIDRTIQEYNVDPARVFVTGISNGGLMSYRLAQEIPNKIAAIAPVVANLPEKRADISGNLPVPILMFNGTADPLMPYNGGDSYSSIGIRKTYLGKFLSVEDTVRYWVKQNGCDTSYRENKLPDSDPNDGTTVVERTFANERNGAEIVQYIINSGGHTWPGGNQYFPQRMIDPVSHDINASRIIVEFSTIIACLICSSID